MSIVKLQVNGKVKKLQLAGSFPLNLQEKTATENGEVTADEGYDGLSKVTVNVEGSGGGECSGTHVIEVDALPTENIDDNAAYKVSERVLTDVVIYDGSSIQSFGTFLNAGAISGSMNVIPTKTTEGVKISGDNGAHAYYIEDENDIFLYGDLAETGTNDWLTVDVAFGAEGQIAYKGEISTMAEATEVGYYAIFGAIPYYAEHGKKFKTMLGTSGLWLDFAVFVGLRYGAEMSYSDTGVLPTKTTENIKESSVDTNTGVATLYAYYIEDEDNIFGYGDFDGSGTKMWMSISDGFGIDYHGSVSGPTEATDEGIYALVTDWDEYIQPSGILQIDEDGAYDVTDKTLVVANFEIPDGYVWPSGELSITENGTHDVKYYETVNVSVASNYMVQTVAELPTDVPDGAFAIVLGGA